MTDEEQREKLVELLKTNACPAPFMCDPTCRYYGYGDCFPDRFADHLIANGVTIREKGEWVWDENAMDWGLGGWICGRCQVRNDNIPARPDVYPLAWVGSNYCPSCGADMRPEPPKEDDYGQEAKTVNKDLC